MVFFHNFYSSHIFELALRGNETHEPRMEKTRKQGLFDIF